MKTSRLHDLMADYQTGEISDADLAELDAELRDSQQARALFHRACRIDSLLQSQTEEPDETEKEIRTGFSPALLALAAAAAILLTALAWMSLAGPDVIATIASAEDAAWESPLPTAPGSDLTAGPMKLTAGIATIRFRSGAEMMLEAPARIHLHSPMRVQLDAGAAVLEVPEAAQGFILDTTDGRVVDHGTSFAVNVSENERRSRVGVIDGEVSIHEPDGGKSLRLSAHESAEIFEGSLSTFAGVIEDGETSEAGEQVVRIGTNGRSHSVIRANKQKWMHPDKLMVKRRKEPGKHERRSFLAFDYSDVDLDRVKSVRLRLNQVPSGIGYASRLPKISDVAVYGLTNETKSGWSQNETWESGPAADDGVLLGRIKIPRSRQRGSRFLDGEELLAFLRTREDRSVTFILDGEINPLTGEQVPSLVLAFASDKHPEAAGPRLEFTFHEDH